MRKWECQPPLGSGKPKKKPERADQALYMSKRKGKNTYSLYDPLDNAFMARLPERFATCIDSDEDPGLANSGMDRYAFGRLHEAGNEEEAVNSILAMIGEQMDVDRV